MALTGVILFALLISISSTTSTDSNANKIVGGIAVDIVKFPFTVSVRFHAIHLCGGSAIAPMWAVTAAHCLDSNIPAYTVSKTKLSLDKAEAGQGASKVS